MPLPEKNSLNQGSNHFVVILTLITISCITEMPWRYTTTTMPGCARCYEVSWLRWKNQTTNSRLWYLNEAYVYPFLSKKLNKKKYDYATLVECFDIKNDLTN
ncbi:hypothetical protein DVH24_000825 [Malus domestica]|uniref:Uncharacterized protein n=1 Tax=Malus domestica TaxID=3750 RepID=A0A498JZ34_MALDO|nr:hypothetical protein DVH24_000825 [Malus domestica]